MGPRRFPALLAALGLAAVVAAACGSSAGPSPSTAATAPSMPEATPSQPAPTEAPASAPASAIDLPTSGRIELPDRGFALTIPDNWFTVDLSEQGIQDALDAGLADLPEGFGDQVRNAISGGISLLAYRIPDDAAAAGTNINVIVLPTYGMSLDTIEAANIVQLQQLVGEGGKVNSERVTLPSGDATVLSYELKPAGASEAVAIEQYFIVGDDNQVVLTCTTPGGGSIGDECRTVAETVELLP